MTSSKNGAPGIAAEEYTRGVGVYPGDPREDFSPHLLVDPTTYRNLALRRPVFQSGSYDYNLTAQLVTDGIVETGLPRWLAVSTSQQGEVSKADRELLFDHNSITSLHVSGPNPWIRIQLAGGETPYEIDRVEIEARTRPAGGEWVCVIAASGDGQAWSEVGRATGVIPGRRRTKAGSRVLSAPVGFGRSALRLGPSIAFARPSRDRFFRISFDSTHCGAWAVAQVAFFRGKQRIEVGGPYNFSSAWMPEGKAGEWVYVDLGARCEFDRVRLQWIRRAPEGVIQISDDASAWTELGPLPAGTSLTDDLPLSPPATARYVRVLVHSPASPGTCILGELEVYGRGGPVPVPKAAPAARVGGRLDLAGGAWRLQRDSLVDVGGATLSEPGFKDKDWVAATVPGTVLSSYWNAGALPDPNFGDNQLAISDSFFYADFWYRTEFTAPRLSRGRRLWLNFDGINWKAEAYLNGERLGRIEGAFMRGRFDVTGHIRPGGKNALAVRIEKNATPGSTKQKTFECPGLNGGALGADNPTYHASIGWDWIPTVRGRNLGIWNDVYLTTSGPVTIESPNVRTALPLPDTSYADLGVGVSLVNHESRPVSGTLRGSFGKADFTQPVTLDAGSRKTLVLDSSSHPALRLLKPKLWWPAGYGEPHLYDFELQFDTAGRISDAKSFCAGVRQFAYSEEGGALRIYINGRRFIPRGGNWGFPEINLRYRRREYDIAARCHRDLNFTMIRNWVGQTGDDEFYEACDRYGIVVWQDFWLANPTDGPNPDDRKLFLKNARDTVLRIRNHPCLGLYCGRNEGYPPKPIDRGIRKMLAELHPGIRYIPHSAAGGVSGHGPYSARPPEYYFEHRATPRLHTELGMPNIVEMESLRRMMPDRAIWPQGLTWGLHDYSLTGAQRLSTFQALLEGSYGGAKDVSAWVALAQFVNYSCYRAMFEAQGRNRMGLLLWMSHACWPSLAWQTYDYYFDHTGAYYGSKKGCEPLHIQWNPVTDSVEVVNYSAGNVAGLTARAEILNLDGSVRWKRKTVLDSLEDSISTPIRMEYPAGLTPVHFVRLRLTRGVRTVSENFYWRGNRRGDYRALRNLPKVKLDATTRMDRRGNRWILTTTLLNSSSRPALMVRLTAVRSKSGDSILPAFYSDNYLCLMPGEHRTVRTELEHADTRGEKPGVILTGFNVRP
jgi:hypothetical protein